MKRLTLTLAVLLLSFSIFAQQGKRGIDPIADMVAASKVPMLNMESPKRIPGEYIVVFNDNVARSTMHNYADQAEANRAAGDMKVFRYQTINGFAAKIPPGLLKQLQEDTSVAYIEANATVSINAVQSNPTWGLDRIDQCALPLDNLYDDNGNNGTGVRAYILDSGVCNSGDFGGRLVGTSYSDPYASDGGPCASGNSGHGTHVAGTVGGTVYGVAKNVTLHDIRVLNGAGSGSIAAVVGGIDWVAANHVKPAVANMSLGGGASTSIDNAVNNAVAAGVVMVVAAGNSNANACNSSPARAANAITVGSTTSSDARSSFSNFGTCVDIFAPGSSITSTWNTGFNATASISGTSMASPHVAGVAALILDASPSASPASVTNTILNWAAEDYLTGIGSGSPNLLLQNQNNSCPNGGAGGGPSCLPSGASCSSSSDCCSGSCSGWFSLTCN